MEGPLNPKKYNHPPQKVKSFGLIQVGLQAKIPKYEPWSAVVIPRFCYWINTCTKSKAESSSQEATCRRVLDEAISRSLSPSPASAPSSPSVRGACAVGEAGVWLGAGPGEPALAVCVELAGEVWLQLLIFCWLTWDGFGSFVAPSHSWELVLLWEQFLAKPKCYPSPRTASWGTEGSTVPQLCNRL